MYVISMTKTFKRIFGPKGTGPFKESFKKLLHQQLGQGMQQGTAGRGHCQFNLRKQAREVRASFAETGRPVEPA